MATIKKYLGKFPVLVLLAVLTAVLAVNAAAVTVNIESFSRGAQDDLRSSELLEAKVEGYDGNVRELTYEWTSTLGTYLYVYNNHNMYGINNTDGEIEIYNTDKNLKTLGNMEGRNYNKTFTGKGYAWAAIYGASVSSENLVGVITVKVYDTDGKLLATDTHEGKRVQSGGSWWRPTYVNEGIIASNLVDDVSHVRFGLFEGDTKNVKILLGESSIVHITCVECTISNPVVTKGQGIIELEVDKETQEWHIKSVKGTSYGDAKVQITIKKGNCKFHKDTSATREIDVFVYKKPTTTSTATAIMLDNLDDNCFYFIGGVEGEKQTVDGKEYVVFENLTPNTQYQIEVVGQAADTEPVYAYVYETTKPAHVGTVKVFINGTYDTATGTANGTLVNIEDMMPSVETLYLRYEDSEIYFPLASTEKGIYYSELSDGNYTLYYSVAGSDEKVKLGDQILTINGASRTRDVFFNSVTYDSNGGDAAIPTEYHLLNSKVMVSDVVPTKEGYLFTHWSCQDSHIHEAGDVLAENIGKEYNLVAQYIDANDVYVNIVIEHTADDGISINNDRGMHDITFTVDQRFGTGNYTELVSKSVEWDGASWFSDDRFMASYSANTTYYYAKSKVPMLENVAKDAEYTFTTHKSGYDLLSVTSELSESGDWYITATLRFNPNDFDIVYSVELDEESLKVSKDLWPKAVNVKVTCWSDPVDDIGDEVMWWHISQHHDTYERIELDENGYGEGTYPVWTVTTDDNPLPYSYRIEIVSYEMQDGTIVEAINKDGANVIYHTPKNRFSTEVVVDGGNTPSGSTLSGVYYDSTKEAQQGTLKGIITIEVFEIVFDPNGGVLNGTTDDTLLTKQVGIPNLDKYVPTREGGYVFDGWYGYIKDVSGTEPAEYKKAVSDTVIFADTTLVAKWIDPLTVKGEIAVAGSYTVGEGDEETTHIIPEHDRLKTVEVLLQHIGENGYAETIKYATVPVTFDGNIGIASYEFSGLENHGHDYRIKVSVHDYHSHYNNDTTGIAFDKYENYKEDDKANWYLAAFVDDADVNSANVYAYLHFYPETFDLKYQINSSLIGDKFAPTDAEVLVLCDTGEHIDPQHWTPISQMIHGNEYKGNVSNFVNNVASGSEPVWMTQSSSGKAYDYSIRVEHLTILGQNISYNDYEWPFYIAYNGSARYSDINKEQTQLLTATLIPRMYTLTFEMGNLPDGTMVEGMDEYVTLEHTFVQNFYWSHGTVITAAPKAEGYVFLGWYDEDGNRVTTIDPSVAEDVTVYAKWVVEAKFEVLADAGYYAATRDSEEREGIIAFNAHITNLDEVKDVIDAFGIFVYDAAGTTVKAEAKSVDMEQLSKDEGKFHITVSGIDPTYFDDKIYAAPFVVAGDEIIMGKSMTIAVNDSLNENGQVKWLGEKGQTDTEVVK